MTTFTAIRRILAVMRMPRTITGKISRIKTIWDRSQASTWMVATVWPAGVDAAITDLDAAQVLADMRTAGAVEDRNTKLAIALGKMRLVKDLVQNKADTMPANAEAIILDCGLNVRHLGVINKQDFRVRNGLVSGQIVLDAHPSAKRVSHEWEISTDHGVTWAELPPSLKGHAIINGQLRGAILFFRHREVLKTGPSDWKVRDIVVL
jgi:hypothetical protein